MEKPSPLQRTLLGRAGALFFLGMLTGLWAGVVLSGGRAIGMNFAWHPKHERLVLGAHLNALLGCFWLLGVAFTLPLLGATDERGQKRLAMLTTIAAYGNWSITLLASILDARGLAFLGEVRNDVVAGLLMLAVVIPTLAASFLWARGLRRA